MHSSPLPPPTWVATAPALEKIAVELVKYPHIAVDTESNSLHAYREQLCLIQFSTPHTDYLVDPLAINDLSAIIPVFENPGIEKSFHAAEYDLICLKRDLGIKVVNLFDTMQAARILGYKQVGLDSVLSKKLHITLDKKFQKADWGKRPLSRDMLNYARLDTHYLLALRDSLQAELVEQGRWELAQEEFIRLAEGNGNGNGKAQTPAWQRVKGATKCSERQLAILSELCSWREDQARSMNRPLFRVIDDARLVDVAKSVPKTMDELAATSLTKRQAELYGAQILRAVERGNKNSPLARPRTARPNRAYLDRINILSEWRKTAALELGIESDIILPKTWMHNIAEKNPKDLHELAKLMPHAAWRLERFGNSILNALVNKNSKKAAG
jgi:ribonuclease D